MLSETIAMILYIYHPFLQKSWIAKLTEKGKKKQGPTGRTDILKTLTIAYYRERAHRTGGCSWMLGKASKRVTADY